MNPIQLQLIPHQTQEGIAYQHLHIQIMTDDGVIAPADIKGLQLPEIDFTQGVVTEGKSPIWLYGYLVHECHPAAWVGCYDPRLGGAVVVATHTHQVAISQIMKIDLSTLKS
ncbi:MAG: CRISPR-associated ring nuclease Crn3/Csx3 [Microcoleaceae cyanobacterium]